MESNELAERILLDLNNIFKKDPLIDEFDILPIDDSLCNKCPVIHVEHKVALESWCVRHVYLCAYTNFFKWKHHPYKIDASLLLNWTNAILLINPEVETAWNARKELIESFQHGEKEELRFAEIVLSRKPKCSQVYAHRKWVLSKFESNNLCLCTIQQIVERELALCFQTASKYCNNYYAWNHRMWIVEQLLQNCEKAVSEELQATEQWVTQHISDHSGFHYRQFLLRVAVSPKTQKQKPCYLHCTSIADGNHCMIDWGLLGKSNNNKLCNLLAKEIMFLSDLQLAFPGHETLWNHRRFVIHQISQVPACAKSFSPLNCMKCTTMPNDNSGHKKSKLESGLYAMDCWTVSKEENFLCCCQRNASKNEWETSLIAKHMTWLKNVVSCPLSLPSPHQS